jgi:hypothetical protein
MLTAGESTMNQFIRIIVTIMICLPLIPAVGCKKNKKRKMELLPPSLSSLSHPLTPYKVEGSLTPAPGAKVIPQEVSAEAVQMFDPQSGVVKIKSGAGVPATFEPQNILVTGISSTAPEGLLRRIKKVTAVADGWILETEPASLSDAIATSNFSISLVPHYREGRLMTPAAPGVTIVPGGDPKGLKLDDSTSGIFVGLKDYVLFDADDSAATKHDRIVLTASMYLKMGFNISLKTSTLAIEELAITLDGAESGSIIVKGEGAASFDKSLEIGLISFPPMVVPIGSFPLVITPRIALSVGASGTASAKFFTSASESLSVKIGVGYKNGSIEGIKEGTTDASLQPPNLAGTSAEAKGHMGAKGEVSLYGSSGAFAGMSGFVKVKADVASLSPCHTGEAGVTATAGLFAGIFGFKIADWQDSWKILSKDLGSGPCNVQSGTGEDKRLGWIHFPERGSDDDTLTPPVISSTGDGGLIMARSRNRGAYLMKLDAVGTIDFRVATDRPKSARFAGVVATTDGGYAVAASSGEGPILIKFDGYGKTVWSKLLKKSATWDVRDLAELPLGSGFVLGGNYSDTSDINDDSFIATFDTNGNNPQLKRIKGPGAEDRLNALEVANDGSYFAAGAYGYDVTLPADKKASQAWVAHFSKEGAVVWSRGFTSRTAESLSLKEDGSLLVAGWGESLAGSTLTRNPWFLHLDGGGNVLQSVGYGDNAWPRSIAATKDKGALISGIQNFNHGDRSQHNGWISRISESGTVLWTYSYEAGAAVENGLDFIGHRADGRIVAAGHVTPGTQKTVAWWLSLPDSGLPDVSLDKVTITPPSSSLKAVAISTLEAPLTLSDIPFEAVNYEFTLTPEEFAEPVVISEMPWLTP